MTKYAILAATGQIGQLTTQYLFDNSSADLVLFGHDVEQRLKDFDGNRVSFVNGDLKDPDVLRFFNTFENSITSSFISRLIKKSAKCNAIIVLHPPLLTLITI
ncbi:hypothetical protein OGM84_10195, partial [Pediococcus acidilactici]